MRDLDFSPAHRDKVKIRERRGPDVHRITQAEGDGVQA